MKNIISVMLIVIICFFACERKSGPVSHPYKNPSNTSGINHLRTERTSGNSSNNVIKMRQENGIYLVPAKINDVSMEFIFDTGASIISISQTEALFLYKQGKLAKEDFLGEISFVDANGDISEGTILNLKTVTIGNKTINNVQASVVNNLKAPLLLGQSALSQFGKISIDYNKGEIIFE